MSADRSHLDAALHAAATGERPPTVALMHILMESANEGTARAVLAQALAAAADVGQAARLRDLLTLWAAHPGAWATVRGTIDTVAHDPPAASPEDSLRYWSEAFDRLVAASPEASVALYSLGSPDLLAAASDEIVARMEAWGLLGRDRDALDLGCGIGRLAAAMAPALRTVLGLDIAAGMIAEARRRHGGVANLSFAVSTGHDLASLSSASLDLVLAADVFPYLVAAGGGLAQTHVAEIARVLRPGGRALILNYSYRGDLARDRWDVAAAAAAAGLRVERDGTRDLLSWDAPSFLLAV